MTANTELRQFLNATWENPVMGNTFEGSPAHFERIVRQLGAIAVITVPELSNYLREGMPEWSESEIHQVINEEIIRKTLAFCPALTNGKLGEDYINQQSAAATAVGLMYWGDQTMDRGDRYMLRACELSGSEQVAPFGGTGRNFTALRLSALRHIKDKIDYLARPEDAPFVLTCFYNQVLGNEARMQRLSQQYLSLHEEEKSAFLDVYGAHLADISTVSAGFPSITSSLYAIYRQRDPSLPPLPEIQANIALTEMLQACNVTVRIWDELGDWEMDAGKDPSKGVFVINPFNQYHSSFIRRYCQLAEVTKPKDIDALQWAFATFHDSAESRQTQGAFVLEFFRQHISEYLHTLDKRLPRDLRQRFDQYITLCKRVLEIGYVNRIGDIALASPGLSEKKAADGK